MNETKTIQEGSEIVVDYAIFYGCWGAVDP